MDSGTKVVNKEMHEESVGVLTAISIVAKKLVYICSPYAGNIEKNTKRAQRYCRFAYTCNKVPVAPHLHNPQFLDEGIVEERKAGIQLGLELLKRCDELWIFGDVLSKGMQMELEASQKMNIPVRYFNEKCEEREDMCYEQNKIST